MSNDKKQKTIENLKPFPKGVSGNPGGRPKNPEWLKHVQSLPKFTAAKLWSKWLSMTAEDLDKFKNDKTLSSLELGICRAIIRDLESGTLTNIEIGLTRIVGKLGDAPPSDEADDLSKLSQDELRKRVAQAVKVLEMTQEEASGAYVAQDPFEFQGIHK
jgi:hypothetical protein